MISIARAPLRVLGVPRRVLGDALVNARRSLEEVAASVADRTSLLVDLESAQHSGDLRRISTADCWELLAHRHIGRLAYMARSGVPDIVPVNYVLSGEDVLIRSAPGPKLQAAERHERVAFEVDDIDEDEQRGWSVVVAGLAERLTTAQTAALPAPLPWASGSRRHILRIRPIRIDGRQLL